MLHRSYRPYLQIERQEGNPWWRFDWEPMERGCRVFRKNTGMHYSHQNPHCNIWYNMVGLLQITQGLAIVWMLIPLLYCMYCLRLRIFIEFVLQDNLYASVVWYPMTTSSPHICAEKAKASAFALMRDTAILSTEEISSLCSIALKVWLWPFLCLFLFIPLCHNQAL